MAFQERGLSNAFDADPMDQVRKQLEIGPPADEAEKEKRKGVWSQVLAKISADPNLQRAMMMAGIQMMQAPQPGQTAGGQIAQGLMTGMTAYEGGKAAQQEQERAQREEQRVERRETRMDEQHRAQMEQIRAELDMIPDEKERRRIERELKKIELQYAPATYQAQLQAIRAQASRAAQGGEPGLSLKDMQEVQAVYNMYESMPAEERAYMLQYGNPDMAKLYARGQLMFGKSRQPDLPQERGQPGSTDGVIKAKDIQARRQAAQEQQLDPVSAQVADLQNASDLQLNLLVRGPATPPARREAARRILQERAQTQPQQYSPEALGIPGR